MLKLLTYLYPNSFVNKKSFFVRIRMYSFIRYIIRQIGNGLMPIIYMGSNSLVEKRLGNPKKTKKNLIISLTSFPARISNVNLVIESMLRQTILPERIILWLSRKQFKS